MAIINTNREYFFDIVRPMFGKLNEEQVDAMDWFFDTFPENISIPQLAYALATVFHETAQTMQPITEYGSVSYFDKYEPGTSIGDSLGNTEPGDGYKYRGRGYVMITGRANYTKAQEELDVPLVEKPELACEREVARPIMRRGCLEGWFTGKKFQDYIEGELKDYYNARRVVNGTDCADKIKGHAEVFERALEASVLV